MMPSKNITPGSLFKTSAIIKNALFISSIIFYEKNLMVAEY
jgi:hypothetical protein